MKNILKVFGFVLFFVLIGYLLFYCFKVKKEYESMKLEYNNLQSRFDLLTKQSAAAMSSEPLLGRYRSKISIEELKRDLIKHPKLIPVEGVLGGKMMFYSSDKIFVLNSKWVIAYFEDGHIAGNALLEYDISKNNEISWKVISTVTE